MEDFSDRNLSCKEKFLSAVIKNDIFNMENLCNSGLSMNFDDDLPLLTAAINGKLISLMWLLNHYNSNVNINSQDGTVLICATKRKHYNMVFFLLEKGADVNMQSNLALLIACQNGYTDIVKLLLKYGANFRIDNNYPLILAATCGHLEIVKILLDLGANPFDRNFEAIRNANNNKHYHIVKMLAIHKLNKMN